MGLTLLDTNVLVYAFSQDAKAEPARMLLGGAVVSVQALNEFSLVARRKLGMDWGEVGDAVDQVCLLAGREPVPVSVPIHRSGRSLAERYRLNLYDAMMIAAALSAGCEAVLSEDMYDGLVIEGRLTVRNPFA